MKEKPALQELQEPWLVSWKGQYSRSGPSLLVLVRYKWWARPTTKLQSPPPLNKHLLQPELHVAH